MKINLKIYFHNQNYFKIYFHKFLVICAYIKV
jgi:hypothetical protein